jgi:hypothetical protein
MSTEPELSYIIATGLWRSFNVKRVLIIVAAGFLFNSVQAQDDAEEYNVVLPAEAQKCVLPASPDKIPDDASYDQLKEAKAQIATFQGEVEVFRACLKEAEESPENTEGNKQAIISSFNYSVDMEERIAERFNVAIRSYKERNASN